MKQGYLAFDLGASSGRAVVGTLSDRRLELEEVHRFETPFIEDDGRLFWDIEALWLEVREGIRRGLEACPSLRSVSIDSWALDYVPLDAERRPLQNPRCYRDPRTQGRLDQAFERVPASEIYRRTGIQMMEINTLPQMLAEVEEEPDLVARTDFRLFIADYLHFRMGGRAVAERTMASTSQLMAIDGGRWDGELMARLGIPATQWADIVDPGTVIGKLPGIDFAPDAEGAAIGRPPGADFAADPEVAVIAGCSHDTAAAVAGVPAELPPGRWAYISCGTWSLLGAEIDRPILSEAARAANFTNEAGIDGTIRFLKNLTGLWVLQECEREWVDAGAEHTYAELIEEARAAPSPGAVVNLEEPQFRLRGEMLGKINAYSRRHGLPVPATRGEVVRLILESLAEGYRITLETLENLLDERVEVIHIVGGGSQNELLCRWTAGVCGRPVVAGPVEAAVMGNLLVQARTLGDLPNGTSIRDVVRRSCDVRVYQPAGEVEVTRSGV